MFRKISSSCSTSDTRRYTSYKSSGDKSWIKCTLREKTYRNSVRSVVFCGYSSFLHQDRHDITEILLKVALNTMHPPILHSLLWFINIFHVNIEVSKRNLTLTDLLSRHNFIWSHFLTIAITWNLKKYIPKCQTSSTIQ